MQAIDDGGSGHAVAGVRLGIKEQLGVQHIVGLRAGEVGAGHVIEILLRPEHLGARVVDVQEALQVFKDIGRAHRVGAGIRQRNAVAPGEGKHLLGLQ